MTDEQPLLLASEAKLAQALRDYIERRTDLTALDDMVDEAMAAVNECLQENYGIEA